MHYLCYIPIQWVKWGCSDALSYCPNAGERVFCSFFKDFFDATCVYVIAYINVLFQLSSLPSSLFLCAVSVEPLLFSLRRGIAPVAFKMCKNCSRAGQSKTNDWWLCSSYINFISHAFSWYFYFFFLSCGTDFC